MSLNVITFLEIVLFVKGNIFYFKIIRLKSVYGNSARTSAPKFGSKYINVIIIIKLSSFTKKNI